MSGWGTSDDESEASNQGTAPEPVESSDNDDDLESQDIFEDDEDRQRVMAMSERDREAELYRRGEALERRREQIKLKRDMKRRQKDSQQKARVAETKPQAPPKKASQAAPAKSSSGWDVSDSDESAEAEPVTRRPGIAAKAREHYTYSDDDDNRQSSSASESEAEAPSVDEITVTDLNSIRLSRHKLELWFDQPFFDETINGCFTRMNIGLCDGMPMYRLVEISHSVRTQSRTYYIRGRGMCNRLLAVKFGRAAKTFPIKYVSNHPFTDAEFYKWKMEMASNELPLPPRQQISERKEAIQRALTYEYTNEDIEKLLKEKREAALEEPLVVKGRNFGHEKAELTMQLEVAMATNDNEKAESLLRRLEELDLASKEYNQQKGARLNLMNKINKRARLHNKQLSRKFDLPPELEGNAMADAANNSVARAKRVEEEKEREKREEQEREENETERMRRKTISPYDLEGLHAFDIGLDIDFSKLLPAQVPHTPAVQPPNRGRPAAVRSVRLETHRQQYGLL